MQYRKFGKTDLEVSEIGFGAWAIGGNALVGNTPIGWGPADDATSEIAIKAALDAGINFFDTADFYGLGHSESLLGRMLQHEKNAIIATKVGHRAIENRIVLDYSKSYIIEACEASLKRLKRETIDYYQLHSARMEQLKNGDCMEAMEQLKEQGKIRYWGLSLNTFHPQAEAEYLMQLNVSDGFQLVFNLINQNALDVIKSASAKGYGIIARMPLQFGLLTGKFTSKTKFTADDHRSFRLPPVILQQSLGLLEEKVWPLAEEMNMSKTTLALSFILSIPGISTTIPGIRTSQHVEQNTSSIKTLPPAQMLMLQSMGKKEWKPVMQLMEQQG